MFARKYACALTQPGRAQQWIYTAQLRGTCRQIETFALHAWRGNWHRLFTNQAGIVGGTWPDKIWRGPDAGRCTLDNEQKFFHTAGQDRFAWRLLAGGVFSGFGD